MAALKQAVLDPMWAQNPITTQVLGVCSAIAVTVQLAPALVMGAAVTVVLTASNLIISLLRHRIPHRIRILVMLAVIASLVIVVDQLLRALLWDVSKQLSIFVGLIITNCVVPSPTIAQIQRSGGHPTQTMRPLVRFWRILHGAGLYVWFAICNWVSPWNSSSPPCGSASVSSCSMCSPASESSMSTSGASCSGSGTYRRLREGPASR